MSKDEIPRETDTVGKSIVFTYLFSLLSAVTGFLIVVVFSWLLSPEEWGAFTVAKRSGTLISTIALLGIPVAISRYIPMERARKSAYASYYGTNAVYIVALSSIGMVLIWGGGLLLARPLIVDDKLYLPLLAATFFFVALVWQLFLASFLRAEGYIRKYNQMMLAGQVFQLIMGVMAIILIGRLALYTILGSSTGILIVVFLLAILLKRLDITYFKKEYLKKNIQAEVISYGIPRMGMGILEILLLSFSLLLLGFTGNTVEAGLFAIALQFAAIMQLVFQPIAVVMLPEFSKLHGLQDAENTENKIQTLLQGWLYIVILMVCLLLSYINHIFEFMFKADYIGAVNLIIILLIGIVPFSFYLTTYSYINAILKRPFILYILLLGLFINIVLYFFLVPILGAQGAAIATASGMAAVGGLMVVLLLRYQPRAFLKNNLSDLIICSIPLVGIFVISRLLDNILVLIVVTIPLIALYIYTLKARNISWYAIVEKNYLHSIFYRN